MSLVRELAHLLTLSFTPQRLARSTALREKLYVWNAGIKGEEGWPEWEVDRELVWHAPADVLRRLAAAVCKRAAALEKKAATERRAAWRRRLQDGAKNGGRLAHRLSRLPPGQEPDRRDDTGAPCDQQGAVHQRAEVWQKVWKAHPPNVDDFGVRGGMGLPADEASPAETPEPLRPSDFDLALAPTLPAPSVARMRAVSRSFAVATSYGKDGLHPRHIAMLSDEGIQGFIDIFMAAERLWRLPKALEFIPFALLLRPDGGDRPIGLFAAALRVWMRHRREVARDWERSNSRPFFYGGEGKSAVDCAWAQSGGGTRQGDWLGGGGGFVGLAEGV